MVVVVDGQRRMILYAVAGLIWRDRALRRMKSCERVGSKHFEANILKQTKYHDEVGALISA